MQESRIDITIYTRVSTDWGGNSNKAKRLGQRHILHFANVVWVCDFTGCAVQSRSHALRSTICTNRWFLCHLPTTTALHYLDFKCPWSKTHNICNVLELRTFKRSILPPAISVFFRMVLKLLVLYLATRFQHWIQEPRAAIIGWEKSRQILAVRLTPVGMSFICAVLGTWNPMDVYECFQ